MIHIYVRDIKIKNNYDSKAFPFHRTEVGPYIKTRRTNEHRLRKKEKGNAFGKVIWSTFSKLMLGRNILAPAQHLQIMEISQKHNKWENKVKKGNAFGKVIWSKLVLGRNILSAQQMATAQQLQIMEVSQKHKQMRKQKKWKKFPCDLVEWFRGSYLTKKPLTKLKVILNINFLLLGKQQINSYQF